MGECSYCEEETHDVEEYCHHCSAIVCFECLENEWCEACEIDHFSGQATGER